jgi:hypothetical protein
MALLFQPCSLGFNAAGKLGVEAAIVFDYPPVRCYPLLAVLPVLLCYFGDDVSQIIRLCEKGSISQK